MIKCEVTKGHTKITACGDIPTLGADLTNIFHGLLSEMPENVKHDFMLSFMMAFDSGLIFDTDSKGMRKLYDELWEMLDLDDEDEEEEESEDPKESASKAIDGLLDVLIKARDEIKSLREKMEDSKNETK